MWRRVEDRGGGRGGGDGEREDERMVVLHEYN